MDWKECCDKKIAKNVKLDKNLINSLKKGYKIYNHECYTAFLKEIIGESEKGEEFDKIRIERNAINYYAKEISLEEAKGLIDKIKHLRDQVLNLLDN